MIDPDSDEDDTTDEPVEDDSWSDSDTFTSIGWGTDEDYGHYGN